MNCSLFLDDQAHFIACHPHVTLLDVASPIFDVLALQQQPSGAQIAAATWRD